MKCVTLGKKIKELRLQKKLTQAELAGDTITRNMLSQIENGIAQPSVTTIVELAEKLGTPTEYFFSEIDDLDAFRKIAVIEKIKKLYAAGDYTKCLSRLENLDVWDDETEILFARAAFYKGLALYRAGYLAGASDYFQKALVHSEKTIYLDSLFSLAVKRYLRAVRFIRSKETEKFVWDSDVQPEADFKADLAYIAAISDGRSDFDYAETYEGYASHLNIRAQMLLPENEQNTAEMMQILQSILDKADDARFAVLKYYVLCDLELLARRDGDYKCAYECSSARLALAEKMNR